MYSVTGVDKKLSRLVLDEFLDTIKTKRIGLGAGQYIECSTKALGDDKAQSVLGRIT